MDARRGGRWTSRRGMALVLCAVTLAACARTPAPPTGAQGAAASSSRSAAPASQTPAGGTGPTRQDPPPGTPWWAWVKPPAPPTLSPEALAQLEAEHPVPGDPSVVALPAGTAPPVATPSGGWLPGHRIVAYYGNPLSTGMGILGALPAPEMIARLRAQAAAYQALDPQVPVQPALDMVADVAQGSPGPQNLWRARMPYSVIEQELALARDHGMLLMLDLQIGRSTVQRELPYFAPFLDQPDVEIALDPEFALDSTQIPDQEVGSLSATQINWAIDYVAGLVRAHHLPPKIFVVHQWLPSMVTDWQAIHPVPGIQFVMDTDGFGHQSRKIGNYHAFITDQPIQPVGYGGFKLFYTQDIHLMTPQQVLGLQPAPLFVLYQ